MKIFATILSQTIIAGRSKGVINQPLGMNKKLRLTIEKRSASAKRLTAKNPSFGTMPKRESAKKDTAKSTAAVINQVFFYVTLDTDRSNENGTLTNKPY